MAVGYAYSRCACHRRFDVGRWFLLRAGRHFSLRTLLIATTLVAVVLGIATYVASM
jgi:hypothetical protein